MLSILCFVLNNVTSSFRYSGELHCEVPNANNSLLLSQPLVALEDIPGKIPEAKGSGVAYVQEGLCRRMWVRSPGAKGTSKMATNFMEDCEPEMTGADYDTIPLSGHSSSRVLSRIFNLGEKTGHEACT